VRAMVEAPTADGAEQVCARAATLVRDELA
jgi:hypothetical protein